ncbi:hypothetical protein ACH5RR_029911 [Cinchona calisaya]|uniref:Uncharacterized protein n=1 Tax=Cinchona calisaya TaxID=153742 RepID=A0ABD2YWL9_9GENT
MQGRRLETLYVMSSQETYIDKAKKNETADLWHAIGACELIQFDDHDVEVDAEAASLVRCSSGQNTTLLDGHKGKINVAMSGNTNAAAQKILKGHAAIRKQKNMDKIHCTTTSYGLFLDTS